MTDAAETVHATCVAIGDRGVLIQGRSGAGKSDLALRLIDRGAILVADDYTTLTREDGLLRASAPPTIAGMIEVRGIGILPSPYRDDVEVALVVDLDQAPERVPEDSASRTFYGVGVPALALCGLEPSAPIKVELALRQIVDQERA
jgi:serine kinase of HPr protein (carbohydrate metabolism regulator)